MSTPKSTTSVLHLPNSEQLSDHVIGSALIHTKRRRNVFVMDTNAGEVDRPSHPSEEFPGTMTLIDCESSQELDTLSSSCIGTLSKGSTTERANKYAEIEALLILGEKIQRQRWRDGQTKYRKNQEHSLRSLEKDTKRLREVVEQLERRRGALCTTVLALDNVRSVAVEYFNVFRYGLQSTSTKAKPMRDLFARMRSHIAPDVAFNSGRGEGHILQSWWCLSQWFEDIVVDLEELRKASGGEAVLATTTTSFTITEQTLRHVFPHVCDGEMSTYASKLLNQRVILRGWTCFEWDGVYHCVSSITAGSDFLTPMLDLLGSLELVSRLFEKSLVSPTFQWIAQ